jgi:ABC-type transport system involved in Fe-S cluster assembly fused permease/ATPase subunit
MMWRAASGVVDGQMTIGDLVLVNAFLIQLATFRSTFLGIVYREIRQALTDIERMFNLLEENREIADRPMPASCRPARCRSISISRFRLRPATARS